MTCYWANMDSTGRGTCGDTWRFNVHLRGVVGERMQSFRYHGEQRKKYTCKQVMLNDPLKRHDRFVVSAREGELLSVECLDNNQGVRITHLN